jgi:archaemetzincin
VDNEHDPDNVSQMETKAEPHRTLQRKNTPPSGSVYATLVAVGVGFSVIAWLVVFCFGVDRGARPAQAATRGSKKIALQKKKFYIQPLGRKLSNKALREVKTALHAFYGFQVQILNRKRLPRFAYYKPRRRYRAEKLLSYLNKIAPKDTFRIMGLTATDISTTKGKYKDWGIMGLADLSGRHAVISMYRCRLGSKNRKHAIHRLAKVAVHEIGHTLGLEHCPTKGCLMEDANGTNKTCDREYLLCSRCRRKLTASGFKIPSNPKPPWPKPKSWTAIANRGQSP